MTIEHPIDFKNPDWDNKGKCHEWKNHVPSYIICEWETFTEHQKKMLSAMFLELANKEEWE